MPDFWGCITAVAILAAYLWGHWDGAKCQLDIMRGHYRNGLTFDSALYYEEDVRGGKVPRD